MKRQVVGSYARPQDAVDAVKKLQEEGYQKEDISLISSTEARNSISNTTDVEVTTDEAVTGRAANVTKDTDTDDRSMWEKIKGTFSTNDYDDKVSTSSDDDPLYSYQQDLANGNIIVMVSGEKKETRRSEKSSNGGMTTPLDPNPMFETNTMANAQPVTKPTESTDVQNSTNSEHTQRTADETIQLKEEQIDVNTREVQTGEVRAKKRVVEETKTVEVPVRHEEIVVERHKINNGSQSQEATKAEEMVIPISEEQIEVTKHPVVKEEVSINKQEVEDTKQVSETVKKEDITVGTEGTINVNESDTTNRP